MKKYTFVLAPDSFKESLTAKEVCIAMERGLKVVFPDATFIHVPMADGGEGTTQSLIDATGGTLHPLFVTGPQGTPVEACFGITGNGRTAIIEMASASGIQHTRRENRSPLSATTYGTGELIRACLDKGVSEIILGIGGSATNDGGAGMARALGVCFYDAQDTLLPEGGGALSRLKRIDISGLDPRLAAVNIQIACDVTHPLCGESGASAVFGPQKGATPEMITRLDKSLKHYADVISQQLGKNVADIPGSGAAGGLGAGLLAFTGCTLRPGIDIVRQYSRLDQKLIGADYCFTGEGRIDHQTAFGKTPFGVAKAAKAAGIPVIAITGSIGEGTETLYQQGISAIFSIVPQADSLPRLLREGAENITQTCKNIGRLIKLAAQ
ncbi:glycerate kinase [Tatumella terrea]|uniref:glycerate kinase n=1 Tax=Tatumella terrea TaxID=419007 RepID=UPI0031D45F82